MSGLAGKYVLGAICLAWCMTESMSHAPHIRSQEGPRGEKQAVVTVSYHNAGMSGSRLHVDVCLSLRG